MPDSSIPGLTDPAAPPAGLPRRRRWDDFGLRAVSGFALIAVAIASVEIGGTVFVLVWLANAVAILWEWQRLVGGSAPRLRVWGGAILLVAIALLARTDLGEAIALVVGASLVEAALAGRDRRVWAAGGMIYAALLVVSVTALRFSFPFGSRSLIWLFATVWATDVFAYVGGRLIGGPRLWPRVSPAKTWAGTICGVAAGGAIGTFTAARDLQMPTAILPILALTVVTAIVPQAGDIGESAIKRHFGVKDTSRLIPGHGGVMDRLDGFIAAATFAFLFGLVRNLPSVAGGLFFWS